MTANATVISMRSATKKFGRFSAVDDVSFEVSAGEVVGFVGSNGAGKTTTISMLLGFTSPSKGSISLFEQPVRPSNAHTSHGKIGYASGDMELPARMTGRQYIHFVMHQSDGDHSERLEQLTGIFGPQLDKKIGTLSRGNKQKIALVAAFVTEPSLVLLDEPTSGLDPIMQDAFLKLVREERKKGTTIFMSSHYLQEVAEVCTRVLLMKNGKLVEDLSAQQLETTGGKLVSVVSRRKLSPPVAHVSDIEREVGDNEERLSFVFDGPVAVLQKWLMGLPGVIDFEVSERTLEAAFRDLYTSDEDKK